MTERKDDDEQQGLPSKKELHVMKIYIIGKSFSKKKESVKKKTKIGWKITEWKKNLLKKDGEKWVRESINSESFIIGIKFQLYADASWNM